MATKIQLRRDTEANWASTNPILSSGELGLDTTNSVVKIGDGVTAWSSLSTAFVKSITAGTNVTVSTTNGVTTVNSTASGTPLWVKVGSGETYTTVQAAFTAGYRNFILTSNVTEAGTLASSSDVLHVTTNLVTKPTWTVGTSFAPIVATGIKLVKGTIATGSIFTRCEVDITISDFEGGELTFDNCDITILGNVTTFGGSKTTVRNHSTISYDNAQTTVALPNVFKDSTISYLNPAITTLIFRAGDIPSVMSNVYLDAFTGITLDLYERCRVDKCRLLNVTAALSDNQDMFLTENRLTAVTIASDAVNSVVTGNICTGTITNLATGNIVANNKTA